MPTLDLRIPPPKAGDRASAEDMLGRTIKPGDVVAWGQTSGRSAKLEIGVLLRIPGLQGDGSPVPERDGGYKLVVQGLTSGYTREASKYDNGVHIDKPSTLLPGRMVLLPEWTPERLVGFLAPGGTVKHWEAGEWQDQPLEVLY